MGLLSGFGPWIASLLVAGLILSLAFGGGRLRRNSVPLRKPPDTLPLVGNGLIFLQPRQKLFSWFARRERQFGYETYQISVPTLPPGVVINDPTNLEYVFKNEALFNKGEFVKRRSWDLFGYGIINADGDLWKAQRKAGLSFLNTANLRVLTDVALPRHLSRSLEFLRGRADGRTVVDLQAVFHEITSQLMGKMAYNMEMHADDDFTLAFDYASGVTAERFQNPLWFVTELVTGARLRRALSVIRSYGQSIVASAVRDRQGTASEKVTASSPERGDGRLEEISGSLIQSLLDSIGDQKMVADAALNYLSAGRDTTAQALTWTFYLLVQHRYVAGRIRREVQEVLAEAEDNDGDGGGGEGRESANGSPDTTRFTPTSMPYTMAVFYEALRLYPPIPFEIKQCVRATTLPDGTFLPESSVVLWCPWAMNRSTTTWGPDADSFRPERWLTASPPAADNDGDDSGNSKNKKFSFVSKSASEFPVFNGGARTCLGKKMAELLAVQVVAAVVWAFDFVPAFEGERVSKSSLTLPMEGGLPCFVRSRRSRSGSLMEGGFGEH